MGVVARHVTQDIRQNMGFDIMLSDNASDDDLSRMHAQVAKAPYALEVIPHSAAEAAKQWKEETGEDVEELLGVNPFQPELEVRVKEQWANTDSLRAIAQRIKQIELVDDIELQADMIDNVNSNIATLSVALSLVALALLFISFVLINNTVRLTVYARRFIIHTMKLVGATPAFIRRPIIIGNALQGLLASMIAIVFVWLLWDYIATFDPLISALVSDTEMIWIACGLVVTGVVICTLASLWAANRYISLSYDEMFS